MRQPAVEKEVRLLTLRDIATEGAHIAQEEVPHEFGPLLGVPILWCMGLGGL